MVNTMRRKLRRDMWQNRMQFLAIILLCALGTWVFSGLDAAWRMMDVSARKYFTEQNLASEWVHVTPVDQAAMRKLDNIEGVRQTQARASAEVKAVLPGDPDVSLHAFQGEIAINIPIVRAGDRLQPDDLRGCLLEEQFAQAQGLQTGDRFTLDVFGTEEEFIVRGLVLSPEYMLTTHGIVNDPLHYGYCLINSLAIPYVPLNEVLVTLKADADETAVKREVERLLPSALVVDQTAHVSTLRTRNDINMFKNLSYLFPLLAFGVAAMIVLTTLTRMLENQRMQMGTLKALGYHDRAITLHYLNYALVPSIFGALLGLYVGRYTMPYILWDMEASHYKYPYQFQAPISWQSWAVCAAAVLLSCGICLYTYRKSARENTASLLRPKPPKEGERILPERIPALWRRLSFNGKMVVRNMFRNKLRTSMSLIGVLCCTMLIITSLGLQDSVKYFVGNYYDGTLGYTTRADLTADAGEIEAYRRRLNAERVEGAMEKTVSLRTAEKTRTVTLTVLEDDQRLICLGAHESWVALPDSGIAVTEKIAEAMRLRVGDAVTLWLPGDSEPIHTTVSQLAATNIGQGIYMRRAVWERCRKTAFKPTALFLKQPTDACLKALDGMDEVSELHFTKEEYEKTLVILQSMTGVFSLMGGAALGLAFVVLYNMGILNFMERSREYATLKVLGYHQKEIRRLIVRENNLLTVVGVLLGLLPGRWLTAAVLKSCESDQMVYASTVKLPSYLIAAAVTIAFSYFVTRLLTRNVKKIDMVAALKSVE